jgi:hypothetical protein
LVIRISLFLNFFATAGKIRSSANLVLDAQDEASKKDKITDLHVSDLR